ncbi:MAG: hypothetical protein U1F58_14130 [Burkholderiales bacterium]
MRTPAMRAAIAALGVATLVASSVAEAQWVMLARRAVGRVEQMSQQSPQSGGASYDTAAVMLDAPADRVYAAVLRGVANAQGIRITREDSGRRLVEFTNGVQIAGIVVNPLSDALTHMMITSAHTGNQPDAAALVLNAVLRVCRDMNVECSQDQR